MLRDEKTCSFYGYGLHRLQGDEEYESDRSLPEESKLALLGAKTFIFMDRLGHAGYDVTGFLRGLDGISDTVNAHYLNDSERRSAFPEEMMKLDRLNKENLLQREMIEEGSADQFDTLLHLSRDWFIRLLRIKSLVLIAGLDVRHFTESVARLSNNVQQMGERLAGLGLRHFYAALKARQYDAVAAICMGSDFLQTVASGLSIYLVEEDTPAVEEMRHDLWHKEFYAGALCSLGLDFDFHTFDDDTNPLLPEVVDMLSFANEQEVKCRV